MKCAARPSVARRKSLSMNLYLSFQIKTEVLRWWLIFPDSWSWNPNADPLSCIPLLFPLFCASSTLWEHRAIKQFKAQGENLTYKCTFLLTSNKTQQKRRSAKTGLSYISISSEIKPSLLLLLITFPLPFPRSLWWQQNCSCAYLYCSNLSIN